VCGGHGGEEPKKEAPLGSIVQELNDDVASYRVELISEPVVVSAVVSWEVVRGSLDLLFKHGMS